MKVVTAAAMQEADRRAIEVHGIPGLRLMEEAGKATADAIVERFGGGIRRVAILCGRGNNGGDGYVIARLLREQGWEVGVYILAEEQDVHGDAAANLSLLPGDIISFCPDGIASLAPALSRAAVVVDALFGTGIRKELEGIHAEAVELVNSLSAARVAVDIPSGVDATTGKILGSAVSASLTVTFASAKLGHILYPGAERCGELLVADIGIPAAAWEGVPLYDFIDAAAVAPLVRRRPRTAHKGSFGHALIVAGSVGKTGAAALAANSAVRAGSGLVTAVVPASINAVMEVKTTEAMTVPVEDHGIGYFPASAVDAVVAASAGKSAAAVGPGLSWNEETVIFVRRLVKNVNLPLVLDADALNAVSEDPAVLLDRKEDIAVITPHPGEMARLTGKTVAEVERDRLEEAAGFAQRYRTHVVLKGARTVVASPDGAISINGSGNPGMASGGMGDVLTGILASLLGQGYAPSDACTLGVFIHGLAADLAAAAIGETGLTASDVAEYLPRAYRYLLEYGEE